MKRIFLSLSLMLTIAATTFAGNEPAVTDRVRQSFKKEFARAEYVTWSDMGTYFKATFILGGHRAEAYFNTDGEFAGSVRDLFYDQLPLAVMKSVDSRYGDAGILSVREIAATDEISYHVTLEVNDKKYLVKINAGGNITETEKIKK
jgi:hypothetical protein